MYVNLAMESLLGPEEQRNNLIAADMVQFIFVELCFPLKCKNPVLAEKSTFFLKNKTGLE